MWRHRVKPKHDSRKQILLTWLNELNTAGMIGTDDPLTNSQCACALGLLYSSTKKSWAYYQICCLTILTEMWYVAWASLTGMHWTHNTNISKETGEKKRNPLHSFPQKWCIDVSYLSMFNSFFLSFSHHFSSFIYLSVSLKKPQFPMSLWICPPPGWSPAPHRYKRPKALGADRPRSLS